MKDVNASLATYGIKNGSKIMMLGDRVAKFDSPTYKSPDPEVSVKTRQQEQLDLLDSLHYHVSSTLLPKLEHLKSELDVPHSTYKQVSFLAREVGELLLQTQLKVDGVMSDDEVDLDHTLHGT